MSLCATGLPVSTNDLAGQILVCVRERVAETSWNVLREFSIYLSTFSVVSIFALSKR
ncbi:Uncharacterized protein APZ42_014038 [Daphnia magna]|uniref:Uncharacterized protein n=1 Tax=Daphnia magna TaxID=35525 RepID=A0A162QA26_9CRUS|nr:Uncharacterized protein APZ42_014038 [Daphnia magna]